MLFGFKLLLANIPACGGVVNKHVADLCVQGKLDLKSGISMYNSEKGYIYSARFFYRLALLAGLLALLSEAMTDIQTI